LRYQGRITDWNDERGFGFVMPDGGGERVFLHIKSFERSGRRPVGNEAVSYEIRLDDRNRPQTARVHYAEAGHTHSPFAPSRAEATLPGEIVPAALAASGFLIFVVVMGLMGRVPVWVPCAYAGVSIFTFGMYHGDKEKAIRKQWRTPESTLHLLEFAGGWPGALIAQQALRHKNRKATFLLVFWVIVALHIAGWVGFLTLYQVGAGLLNGGGFRP
jgi:uncharacterized membrane protein YsdA (DUF1294 family)/cold shock CspA family protein